MPHALDSPTFILEDEPPLTETSTVVSPFTLDVLAESCPLDALAESPDVHKCQEFVENTCGCHLAHGRPCSSLFTLEHYIQLRAQSSFLTRDELDLTLIGAIMCTVIQDEYVRDGCHKNPKRRKQTTTSYMHHGHEICKKHLHFCMALVKID